jgi:hypothetical protein
MLRQQPTPAAIYLKLSHLETGRRRNETEIARAEAHILSLRAQMHEIVQEQTSLKAELARIDQRGPMSPRVVKRAARSAADGISPARIGFSVRY